MKQVKNNIVEVYFKKMQKVKMTRIRMSQQFVSITTMPVNGDSLKLRECCDARV